MKYHYLVNRHRYVDHSDPAHVSGHTVTAPDRDSADNQMYDWRDTTNDNPGTTIHRYVGIIHFPGVAKGE